MESFQRLSRWSPEPLHPSCWRTVPDLQPALVRTSPRAFSMDEPPIPRVYLLWVSPPSFYIANINLNIFLSLRPLVNVSFLSEADKLLCELVLLLVKQKLPVPGPSPYLASICKGLISPLFQSSLGLCSSWFVTFFFLFKTMDTSLF